MRPNLLPALAAVSATSAAAAAAAGVIPMSISHAGRRALAGRADTYSETLTNNISYGGYFASISVGTPAQAQQVILDTGSSDLWILAPEAAACAVSSPDGEGSASPQARRRQSTSACISTFDTASSTTFTNLSLGFDIEYVDGSEVDGYFFTDTVAIADTAIDALQMGLATVSDITFGIMGIGFEAGESTDTLYPNIISRFYADGLIAARAYSLYLDDLSSSTGSILFGGVDTDKYSGSLIAVPIILDAALNNYTSFTVTLSSVAAVSTNGTVASNYTVDASGQPVILDSGTTLTYLPDTMAEAIMATFGASYDESLGYASVPCAVADSDLTLAYQFGGASGPVITVDASELVILASTTSSLSTSSVAAQSCAFGVSKSSGPYLLGDTFLRSAYAVYDLDAKVVALAQTNFNSSASSVVAMASGSSIPGVVATATDVVAAATGTSIVGTHSESGAARVGLNVPMAPLASIAIGAVLGALLIGA